jgi:excisionase family DNA binding protein
MEREKSPVAKLLLPKREVAAALGCSVRLVEMFIARKELPVRKLGRRTLIPWASVVSFSRRDHSTKQPDTSEAERHDDQNT